MRFYHRANIGFAEIYIHNAKSDPSGSGLSDGNRIAEAIADNRGWIKHGMGMATNNDVCMAGIFGQSCVAYLIMTIWVAQVWQANDQVAFVPVLQLFFHVAGNFDGIEVPGILKE